jgi:hypothetical protein
MAETSRRRQKPRSRLYVWLALVGLLSLMAARLWLVEDGMLFGATRIVLIDIVISAVVLIVAAVLYQWRFRLTGDAVKDERKPSTLLATAVGILGLPALIGGLLNLVAPATPGDLAVPACATAQTYQTPYRAATTGPTGNFARSGPGLGFAQTDRFSKDCVVGFTGYCVGDPVNDPVVKGWNDTRWLLASRHEHGASRFLARWLSKEPARDRYLSSAYLAPQNPDSNLKYLGAKKCAEGQPLPEKATLTAADATTKSGKPLPGIIRLTAQAPHAFNIGIALAVDPDEALDSGTAIRQIPGSGAVTSGNAVHAQWDTAIVRSQLHAPRSAPVAVTVLAVPCLDPLTPATSDTATTRRFTIPVNPGQKLVPTTPRPLAEPVRERLLALACDTQINEAGQRAANTEFNG